MSRVVAVSMVKDEADVIAQTVGHMAANVDAVLVADNGSTDGTREVLETLATQFEIHVLDDPDPAYRQSAKMTHLAGRAAAEHGAEWVVPFDADEVWYATQGTVAELLEDIGPSMAAITAEVFDHVATGADRRNSDPVRSMVWRRRRPLPLPKVACRWRPDLTIHQGNHGCDYDGITPASLPLLNVRHFPYRSPEQFVRKVANGAAAYRAAPELPHRVGAHWRAWGEILDDHGPEAVEAIFRTWYWRENPRAAVVIEGERQDPLVRDPAPMAV